MSYEAWGEPDDPPELPEGCWDEDTVLTVQEAVRALRAEPVYEDGKKENGISARFLMRLTVVAAECGLMTEPHERALADEARAAFNG